MLSTTWGHLSCHHDVSICMLSRQISPFRIKWNPLTPLWAIRLCVYCPGKRSYCATKQLARTFTVGIHIPPNDASRAKMSITCACCWEKSLRLLSTQTDADMDFFKCTQWICTFSYAINWYHPMHTQTTRMQFREGFDVEWFDIEGLKTTGVTCIWCDVPEDIINFSPPCTLRIVRLPPAPPHPLPKTEVCSQA